MGTRQIWLPLLLAVITFLAACNSSRLTTPEIDTPTGNPASPVNGSPAAAPDSSSLIHPVIMRPQTPEELSLKGVCWTSPGQLLNLLPPLKEPTCTGSGWMKAGGDYEDGLPLNLISRSGVDDELGDYTPDWRGGGTTEDLAYGIYRWNLFGFAGQQTMGLKWEDGSGPSDWQNLWIGFGNIARDAWDWYGGPEDGVLTIESFGPYRDAGGSLLMIVVLLGEDPAVLARLEAGAPETRATGDEGLPDPDDPGFPLLGTGGSLPASVDLTPGCAPVNDQQNWGSCTAFAVGDGAYNYELNLVYEGFGWDLNDPGNRVSPKHLYVVSGQLQGFPPGGDYGRWTGEVINGLLDHGVATELNAPYNMIYDNGWSPGALADAAVLTIDSWQEVPCNTWEGINTVKAILARQFKPLPMRMNLDYSFFDYMAGQVYFPQGMPCGGHAMCIVGYDDGKGAFKVRNSWSEYWGEDGYVWIAYEAFLHPLTNVNAWTLTDEYDPAVAAHFQLYQGGLLSPVTGVEASDGTSEALIEVTWDSHPAAGDYLVFRDERDNLVATVTEGATLWQDTGITDSYGHIYWVKVMGGPLSAPDVGYTANPPLVNSVNPTSGTEDDELTFQASGLGSAPLDYLWDFGGGASPNTSTDARPSVTLLAPGTYSASLTLTNSLGSDVYDFDLVVEGIKPVVQYVTGRSGFAGDVVVLMTVATGTPTSYSWDFGGGATPGASGEASPSVTLGAPGVYEGNVTVINDAGSDLFYFALVSADGSNRPWQRQGYDGHVSRQSPLVSSQTSNLRWRFYTGENPEKQITYSLAGNALFDSEGNIYGAGTNYQHWDDRGSFFCLNPNGTLRWRYDVEGSMSNFSPPVISSDGSIYLAHSFGFMLALNSDGTQKWRHEDPDIRSGVTIVAEDGTVILVSRYKYVFFFNPDDGSFIRPPYQHSDSGTSGYIPPVINRHGIMIFGGEFSNEDILVAYDTVAGVPVGTMHTPEKAQGLALSPDGSVVYTTDYRCDVRAYNIVTCGELWKTTELRGGVTDGRAGPAVGADGTVYVVNAAGTIYALNPNTAEVIWNYKLGVECRCTPCLGLDGTVYVGSENRKYYAVRDGELLWESADADTWYCEGSPSIGPDGTVFASARDGFLYAFGTGTGETLFPPLVLGMSPETGEVGEIVTFIPDMYGTDPINYSWDFGGGADPNTSADANPVVTLGDAGTYQGTLSVDSVYGDEYFEFSYEVTTPGSGPRWETYTIDTFDSGQELFAHAAIVDGVPAIAAVDDDNMELFYYYSSVASPDGPEDWTFEMVEDENDVINRLGFAEVNAEPVISYESQSRLHLARRTSGTWHKHIVDPDSSIASNSGVAEVNGKPAIAYEKNTVDGMQLRYARATNALPASSLDWVLMDVSDADNAMWNSDLSIVDFSGIPHIAFAHKDFSGYLAYARSTVVDPSNAGDWSWHYVESDYDTGKELGLIELNGLPAIAYNELHSENELRFAQASSTTPSSAADWSIHNVIDETMVYPKSLVLIGGNPAIGYEGGGGWNHVKLAQANTSTPGSDADWTIEEYDYPRSVLELIVVAGDPAFIIQHDETYSLDYFYFTDD